VKKLLIDAGNSAIKWALLDSSLESGQLFNERLSKIQSCVYGSSTPFDKFKDVFEQQRRKIEIDAVVMVSVLGDGYIAAAKKLSQESKLKFTNAKPSLQLAGVTSAYSEPHKLGADRLVAMIGAHHLETNQASIVVDSGTATTIDAVDAQGQHLGGLILPGIDLCSQSLLEETEMLALFNQSKSRYEPNIFSTNTKQAIASGSIFGLSGAVKNICLIMEKEIRQKNNSSIVIKKLICGGAASKLLPYLSKEFKHHDDLLMQGLKIISEQDKKPN
jgi:type III pantothenate kinase